MHTNLLLPWVSSGLYYRNRPSYFQSRKLCISKVCVYVCVCIGRPLFICHALPCYRKIVPKDICLDMGTHFHVSECTWGSFLQINNLCMLSTVCTCIA